MSKNKPLEKFKIVRSRIKKDIFYFLIPFFTVFCVEMWFCMLDELSNIREMEKYKSINLQILSVPQMIGVILTIMGLVMLFAGYFSLRHNYSSTLVIRENHQLITHGIYRYVRHPIYLGVFLVAFGLPVYVGSLYGFLSALVLIPIILNRIRMEEELLMEEFPSAYQKFKETSKKIIPFIY